MKTRAAALMSLRDLLRLDGAPALCEAWLSARAGEPGWLFGPAARASACAAQVTPVITGTPDWDVLSDMADIFLDAHGVGDQSTGGGQATGERGTRDNRGAGGRGAGGRQGAGGGQEDGRQGATGSRGSSQSAGRLSVGGPGAEDGGPPDGRTRGSDQQRRRGVGRLAGRHGLGGDGPGSDSGGSGGSGGSGSDGLRGVGLGSGDCGDNGGSGTGFRPAGDGLGAANGLSASGRLALERTLLGMAVRALAGPGGLAGFLRANLLGRPFSGDSLVLDVGATDDIPDHVRRAVMLRDRHCQWPGGCDRPAAQCEPHHRRPRAEGGDTSLGNLDLYCRVHHHHYIHRVGWTIVKHPDGSREAISPTGRRVASHGPRRSDSGSGDSGSGGRGSGDSGPG